MKRYQNNNSTASGGLGLGGVLTVIFIVLKLCGLINWSWWWVLSPIWISIGLAVVIIFVAFIVSTIICWIEARRWRK